MTATLIESREIAPGVRHFVFETSAAVDFKAGQFFSLVAHGVTRAYSIASTPHGSRFELCLNLVEEGKLSPVLFAMATGESIECTGPYGTFTLREPASDCVFIATGTGIAPFRGMLPEALSRGSRVTLLFGARSHVLYQEEFERIADGRFLFWPTLTRPAGEWTGRRGRVQQHLDEALDGRTDVDVYICGLKAMVDDVRAILKARGFDRRRVVYEKFD